MAVNIIYTLRKGSKGIGENGFTSKFENIKKFNSIQEAANWLDLQDQAPAGIYGIDAGIEKTAEEL